MYETYAEAITVTGLADHDQVVTRLREHVENPTGPVRVLGGPGTGKVHAVREAVVAAGHEVVVFDGPSLFGAGVNADLEAAAAAGRDFVFVVADLEAIEGDQRRYVADGIKALAEFNRVRLVVVVTTTRTDLVRG